jgi:hypothetical protein
VDIPLRQTIALSLSFGHVNLTLDADVSPGNLLRQRMQVSQKPQSDPCHTHLAHLTQSLRSGLIFAPCGIQMYTTRRSLSQQCAARLHDHGAHTTTALHTMRFPVVGLLVQQCLGSRCAMMCASATTVKRFLHLYAILSRFTLPCAQIEATICDWHIQRAAKHARLDMRWHVIIACTQRCKA